MICNFRFLFYTMICSGVLLQGVYGDNQTPDVSPVISGDELPFSIRIEQTDFSLPQGIHSYAFAQLGNKVLLLTGRIQGLHGFNPGNNNFPPDKQNTTVYVVDLESGAVASRSLLDSGLTQEQIDLLSVTSAQHLQKQNTLYIVGGYGVDSATGEFSTKNCLTAIDVLGMMHWVEHPRCAKPLSKYIRQIFNDVFQVTGGVLRAGKSGSMLLIFGQNFEGFYHDSSNGDYLQDVRRFRIIDNGKKLAVKVLEAKPAVPDPNYRRRDLNVVPIVQSKLGGRLAPAFVALSGVFTLTGGYWTVPVMISSDGSTSMPDPNATTTFKQPMNIYECASAEIYSVKRDDMYIVLFGGITYGLFENGQFTTDSELPFTNQITTIRIDKKGRFTQHIMDAEYPVILSTASNPGNPLLFGTDAEFFPAENIKKFSNEVLIFDLLPKEEPLVLGYIIGGIQSTLPNTNSQSDSAASPYIFKVIIDKKEV